MGEVLGLGCKTEGNLVFHCKVSLVAGRRFSFRPPTPHPPTPNPTSFILCSFTSRLRNWVVREIYVNWWRALMPAKCDARVGFKILWPSVLEFGVCATGSRQSSPAQRTARPTRGFPVGDSRPYLRRSVRDRGSTHALSRPGDALLEGPPSVRPRRTVRFSPGRSRGPATGRKPPACTDPERSRRSVGRLLSSEVRRA